MGRHTKAVGKPVKKRRPKEAANKPRGSPKARRDRSARGVNREAKVAKLTRGLREALEHQAATADILKVIASSPSDVQPVFDAIAERSNRLIDGHSTSVLRFFDDVVELAAFTPVDAEADAALQAFYPLAIADLPHFELVRDGKVVQITDSESAEGIRVRDIARARGWRSVLLTPLSSDKGPIGLISVTRKRPGTFAPHHVQLLKTFADQAVIAIQNARLFDEVQARTRDLTESLQQQTATADVLKVISSSPGDMKPVFEAILSNALRICEAKFGHLLLYDGESFHATHLHDVPPSYREYWEQHGPIRPSPNTGLARLARTKQVAHIPDLKADATYAEREPLRVVTVEQAGARSFIAVPMLKESRLIGAIVIYRKEVRPFTDKQIELVKNFAAQAVIAIENTRLLQELRESVQRQTATTDVLKVISRSAFDLEPVLATLVASAARLCEAERGLIFLRQDNHFRMAANYGFSPELEAFARANPFPIDSVSTTIRAAMSGSAVQAPDLLADETQGWLAREYQRLGGHRTNLGVPLRRDGETIGVFTLTRQVVRPFTEKQIELVSTFADQAVIAIENVRLFDEVQAKTRDLAEALTYQTGSSNILRVIASSPTDVGPVLQAIVDSACELCDAYDALVRLKDGDDLRLSAHHGPIPTNLDTLPISRSWTAGCAFLDQKPVHVHDLLSSEGDQFPEGQALSRLEGGHRTILSVPMLRESESIGVIVLRRIEVHPFSDKQITLLQTFASQAVIAIGNVRLFDEVQSRTRDLTESLQQQTATADVLKVISASPGELGPVFQAMLENAVRLCEAKFAMLFLHEENQFRAVGGWNLPPAWSEFLEKNTILADPMVPLGRVAMTKQPVQVADVLADQAYIDRYPGMVAVAELGRARTLLQVPMLKDNELVGTIGIYRQEVRPFTDKQIALVQNFAAQAVIAIENARLLNELRQRTDDLTASLDDLRTAQDRLVQTEKLASLGQLTAGIAHEIKNPLNFVNNFSALSAELVGEMSDVLADAALDKKTRSELGELAQMLKTNLEKVVQHGKRADSIVKNMLLHSREGTGEHRPVDINAIVDESLNLAYHGARAEKAGFNITMQRNFDPAVGMTDVYPQEITRVLLNLISNGFYATTKRRMEAGDDFEPTLNAATKNLGDKVEIRIRDNGTGIPADVKEKIFHPFFTTKPAGEGTGLGLSMTHDIIVKQHGGTIEVETEQGQFTEFRIILPRKART